MKKPECSGIDTSVISASWGIPACMAVERPSKAVVASDCFAGALKQMPLYHQPGEAAWEVLSFLISWYSTCCMDAWTHGQDKAGYGWRRANEQMTEVTF